MTNPHLKSSMQTLSAFGLSNIGKTLFAATALVTAMTMTACSDDDDSTLIDTPKIQYSSVEFTPIGSYVHGEFDESAAEIVAYHPPSKRSFVVNAQKGQVDVLDVSDPTRPQFVAALDASDIGGDVNSVAVYDDIVALAVESDNKTDNGYVAFYDANELNKISDVMVGALPDMVTFTPDGNYALVANEGEPNDEYTIDPEGSISVINIMDINRPLVETATFTAFNSQQQSLIDKGVRIFGELADGRMSTVAQDLEPEYIAIDDDGQTAFVSLQENNAIAVMDIASASVTDIIALGAKDHSLDGYGLDVSNKDDAINIKTWPIFGMYQPDAIATYQANGKTYLVTANEGDARTDWGDFDEEIGFDDVMVDTSVYNAAACHDMACNSDAALGKIDFTRTLGDDNGDGVYEKLYSFGARSFSIWDTTDMSQPAYDSGDLMAQLTADKYPDNFNASNDKNDFDNRSDNKGVEPEGVTIGQVGSQTIAFIGLERISSVMAFDVTDPDNVAFLGEINTRTFDDEQMQLAESGDGSPDADGDLGPEGLTFIASDDSPNGKPLLMVGFEVSGTSKIFELNFTQTQ